LPYSPFRAASSAWESHRAAAEGLGIPADEIERAQEGISADPAIAAMIAFGVAVYRSPSAITDADIEHLRELHHSDREIADVVGIVASNVLTGAFNLAAGLRP
jgi:hypothetical protein